MILSHCCALVYVWLTWEMWRFYVFATEGDAFYFLVMSLHMHAYSFKHSVHNFESVSWLKIQYGLWSMQSKKYGRSRNGKVTSCLVCSPASWGLPPGIWSHAVGYGIWTTTCPADDFGLIFDPFSALHSSLVLPLVGFWASPLVAWLTDFAFLLFPSWHWGLDLVKGTRFSQMLTTLSHVGGKWLR